MKSPEGYAALPNLILCLVKTTCRGAVYMVAILNVLRPCDFQHKTL